MSVQDITEEEYQFLIDSLKDMHCSEAWKMTNSIIDKLEWQRPEPWTLWQEKCGKPKPTHGTYTDVEYFHEAIDKWREIDFEPFEFAHVYRYRAVAK